jgi:2-haloacid dehalogenase
MKMPRKTLKMEPRIIFFDVVETVFSLAPLADKRTELKLPVGTDRLFFAQLLRDAFALSASGVFHTFPDIAKGTLTVLLHSLGREVNETMLKEILGTFSRLPAHRDVKPALEKMKSSNGSSTVL